VRIDGVGCPPGVEHRVQRPSGTDAALNHASAHIESDAGEPGSEAVRPAEPIEPEHRVEHRFLRRVRSHLRVYDCSPAHPQQQWVVPVDQLRERGLVAPAGGGDQSGVSRICCHGLTSCRVSDLAT